MSILCRSLAFFDFLLRWAGAALLVKFVWAFATNLEEPPTPVPATLIGGFLAIGGFLVNWRLLDLARKQTASSHEASATDETASL